MKKKFVSYFLLALCCSQVILAQQPPADAKFQIAKLEVTGLQSRQEAEIIPLTQLKIGQTIDLAGIRAAAQRLSDTEIFKKVGTKYQYYDDKIEVTFVVEEALTGNGRCIFDNFFWFQEAEILAAVKQEIPNFDGTAPASNLVIGQIKQALVKLLATRRLPGDISYELTLSADHQFSVNSPLTMVCEVTVTGAEEKLLPELQKAARELVNQQYSQTNASQFSRAAMQMIFEENGYLQVKFKPAVAEAGTKGECRNRAVVTLATEPGLRYNWERAEWSGNQALAADKLEALLQMKTGDVANLDKIRKGLGEIRTAYADKGYMRVTTNPIPVFDDAAQRVTFRVQIAEGPQFRWGELNVEGFGSQEANELHKRWPEILGKPAERAVLEGFLEKAAREGVFGKKAFTAHSEVHNERQMVMIKIKAK
jgi:outer membrane protein assembly factor BamA